MKMKIENIAKGNLSCGGYVGPEIVVKAVVGYTTTIIDPRYVDGMELRVRVDTVGDTWVGLSTRRVDGHKRFERYNPIPRVAR